MGEAGGYKYSYSKIKNVTRNMRGSSLFQFFEKLIFIINIDNTRILLQNFPLLGIYFLF